MQWLRKVRVATVVLASSVALFAQAPKSSPAPPSIELPAALQTKVVAGATPVGTEVKAKLTMATLIDGVVIPQDAVILGHVEQSIAKSAATPAVLTIKFESAQWKKGSAPVALYLAGCYYPIEFQSNNDPSGMHGEVGVNMGSAAEASPRPATGLPTISGTNPSMSNGGLSGATDASRLDADPRANPPVAEISTHWVRMENVDTITTPDGSLQITSRQHNLKLHKGTIYLLRNSPPSTGK